MTMPMTTLLTPIMTQSPITELNQSPFNVRVDRPTGQEIFEFASEYEVLVACKQIIQTAIVMGTNCKVMATARAKQWGWSNTDSAYNILKGFGETRDWVIFRSIKSNVSSK